MEVFASQEKIFAAFEEDLAPDWNPNNRFDASPDGLSGTKEGFYFANWLLPFKVPIEIGNISLTPSEYPACIDDGNDFNCGECRFFSANNCPILLDKENIKLTRKGFKAYKELIYWPRGKSISIFDSAQKELLIHGKPLHYQVLTKILQSRYPTLRISEFKTHRILKINPLFFENLNDGVYKAYPKIKRCENYYHLTFWIDEFFQ